MVDVYKNYDDYYVVDYEDNPISPREMFSNLGTALTFNRGYSPDDYRGDFSDRVYDVYHSMEIKRGLYQNKEYVAFPIYILDHSAVSYSIYDFCDPWDSGLAGFIFAKRDDIRKWFGVKKITKNVLEQVELQFKQELEEYTSYCNGWVYCISKYTFKDGFMELEDSCCGYYDRESMLDEWKLSDDNYLGDFYNLKSFEAYLYDKHQIDFISGDKR